MTHKRKDQLTVSGLWARHLRPRKRRVFWKGERQAERQLIDDEARALETAAHPAKRNPKPARQG